MTTHDIQYDLFPSLPSLSQSPETIELMRPHMWATGETCELALVSIELAPHEGKWMWSSCLNSHNGSGQCSKALPKWNRFAPTKAEALLQGADDVRKFLRRATPMEQARISAWLEQQASVAVATA
ncbi:hypothetical protein ACI77O_12760 [Pseudomonas tritici]|uniref:hypothetical protein n=1 Tax=Pseudomonas tritici TaxID=2745518 RepID=UPI00387A9920